MCFYIHPRTPWIFISQFCKSLGLRYCFHQGDNATSIPAECCAMPYIVNGEEFYNWLSVVRCRTFWTVKCTTTGWVLCDAVHSERWSVLQLQRQRSWKQRLGMLPWRRTVTLGHVPATPGFVMKFSHIHVCYIKRGVTASKMVSFT